MCKTNNKMIKLLMRSGIQKQERESVACSTIEKYSITKIKHLLLFCSKMQEVGTMTKFMTVKIKLSLLFTAS